MTEIAELPQWIVAVKEIGLPGTVLGAGFYLLVKYLIPMWREISLKRDEGERAFRASLLTLVETQRQDHREQVQAISKSLDRLCALIVAHDMRSGGGVGDLIRQAELISGDQMPDFGPSVGVART